MTYKQSYKQSCRNSCTWMDCVTPNSICELLLLIIPLALVCIQILVNNETLSLCNLIFIWFAIGFAIFYIIAHRTYRHRRRCSMFHSVCAYRSWLRTSFTLSMFLMSITLGIQALYAAPLSLTCAARYTSIILAIGSAFIFALQCRGLWSVTIC
mgnify:CR=1 FL=1